MTTRIHGSITIAEFAQNLRRGCYLNCAKNSKFKLPLCICSRLKMFWSRLWSIFVNPVAAQTSCRKVATIPQQWAHRARTRNWERREGHWKQQWQKSERKQRRREMRQSKKRTETQCAWRNSITIANGTWRFKRCRWIQYQLHQVHILMDSLAGQ